MAAQKNTHNTQPIFEKFAAQANITAEQYDKLYQQSITDPDTFWAEQAK